MWSAGSKRGGGMTDIYLCERQVALMGATSALWLHEGDTLEVGLAALTARLNEAGAPRRLRLWLGAALCRPVRLTTVAGARTRAERLRSIELAATNQSGLTAPCRIAIDDIAGADDALAVSVEERVLAAIEQALARVRARAVSIRPWWAQALGAALQANPSLRALAVWEGRALTMLTGEGRRFASAQTLYPVDSVDSALAAFARALVSGMIPADDALAMTLDLAASPLAVPPPSGVAQAVFTPWVTRIEARA